MKTRLLQNIVSRYLNPGDSIELMYEGKVVATKEITRPMSIDAVAIFEVEEGEFHENVTDGIGGAFLDTDGRGVED